MRDSITAPKIIILNETVGKSLSRDAGTFATFVGLILVGYLLDSTAMQWVGGVIGFIAIFTKAAGAAKKLTISEARAYLDTLEDTTP